GISFQPAENFTRVTNTPGFVESPYSTTVCGGPARGPFTSISCGGLRTLGLSRPPGHRCPSFRRLPITPHARAVAAGLLGHEQFLQRGKDAALAERIGAEVAKKLIVVKQHVQEKAGATGGTEGHPASLPGFQLRDLRQHGFPGGKDESPRDQLGQPARL